MSVAIHMPFESRLRGSPSTLVGAGPGRAQRPARPSLAQFAFRPESGGISKSAPRRKAYRSMLPCVPPSSHGSTRRPTGHEGREASVHIGSRLVSQVRVFSGCRARWRVQAKATSRSLGARMEHAAHRASRAWFLNSMISQLDLRAYGFRYIWFYRYGRSRDIGPSRPP